VPNTKVLANIQIYVHTKFPIFLRSLNISFQFISHLYGKSNKTGIQIGKGVSGVFLCTGLFLQCPGPSLRASPACCPLPLRRRCQSGPTRHQAHRSETVFSTRSHLSGISSPNPPLLSCASPSGRESGRFTRPVASPPAPQC
jgi:hypothetical protein